MGKYIISIFLIFMIFMCFGQYDDSNNYNNQSNSNYVNTNSTKERIKTCDGYNVVSNCIYDGKIYLTYKYHEEMPAKEHIEKKVKYKNVIVGYCTKCKDGTRSPSCSTGKGTCSHHGGVLQWNAPVYERKKYVEEVVVVDQPRVAAYLEKVLKTN